MVKNGERLHAKLQEQQQGWSKNINTGRNCNKDENLENYDNKVQTCARATSRENHV